MFVSLSSLFRLSFIPPSCMVAPNRKIANINSSFHNSAMSHLIEVCAISEDVNMDVPRGRSILSSPNSSRELLAHSDLSSVPYVDRMEHKMMTPPGLIKQNKKTFICPMQLSRKRYPTSRMCQVWFTPGGESPWGWLGDTQSV